ncbi:efflux RND transporter periplasmic adaptor subunit [Algiphilus sp.]|uniref:efflux RND transporter periplasmic adaptor subunit n=1 Tax=Algiphilus sp. TaxID=1872431 RepID=UPI0025BA2778|nr:efflux RND transporter periplasmic adaptor subunit [Algiphilus sp.]MCK5770504.1 efflux RND transporter periplasmic adaptor subunit [Algiphilus sp.]
MRMPRTFPADRSRALAVVVLGAALAACGTAEQDTREAAPRAVRVAAPEAAPASPDIAVVGRLELRDEQQLAFRVGGIVDAVNADAGDRIEKGQVLARLDTTEVDAGVEQARASADKARRDLERGERLHADNVITQQQLDDLETAFDVARARLETARFNQRHAIIRAPADGVVLRRMVEPNETVAGGQPVLAVGDAGSGFVLAAAVPDRDALRLALADPARITVDAMPDAPIRGAVSRIGRQADPRTGTFEVDVALEEAPERLASGLLARARITTADSGETARTGIPLEALVEGDSEAALIFLLADDNARVQAREVTVRWFDDERAVLGEPLSEQARVVTTGAGFLRDGEAVRIIE